ncbi:MAG: FAD:protein FMN transferase [Frankiales bacterium]|nr:FAD:protein FMN transferase [Frankiales bacterium]
MNASGDRPVRRLRHAEQCMGTVFTIDIRDPGDWADAVLAVVDWLHFVDATFSTYRESSDISRMRRGTLRLEDAHPLVREVLEICARVESMTGGCFTARPDGGLNPTGLVKGWSIERASAMLSAAGAVNHAVSGGGDMQLAGEAAPGQPWTVGIVDPFDRRRLLTSVAGRDFAVATSGIAERGRHIVDPFSGRPAVGTTSVSVVGPSATDADVLATAMCVMGDAGPRWLDSVEGFEAFVVTDDHHLRTTQGWGRWSVPRARETLAASG